MSEVVFGSTFEEENPELAVLLGNVGLIDIKREVKVNEQDWLDVGNFKPEAVDDDPGFKPIKGAYICRIDKLEHIKGENKETHEPFEFYSLSAQVTETLEGNKGDNRYLKKTYRGNADGVKSLLTDMFTSGIELDRSSPEAFDMSLGSTKDKTIKIRAWVWKPEKTMSGAFIPKDKREPKQSLKIVKDFKLSKGGKEKETLDSNKVPF
jgi:hypothetical protein